MVLGMRLRLRLPHEVHQKIHTAKSAMHACTQGGPEVAVSPDSLA